jgi:hypothetical protein
MCNFAAYVGSERAAPILLEMLERQEGLAGGYYTGVATVHGGKLSYAKVVGDTARLRAETDAEDLPGTIGLAHSRSNSGGDEEFAHPFIACEERLAYVAVGSMGHWAGDDRLGQGAQRLADAGHRFRAVHKGQIGSYPMLRDGTCVHMSDVMAHAIEAALDELGDPEAAIRTAFLELPSEIVGLYVTPAHPETIYGARWNVSACAARSNSGTYLASAPAAFPDDTPWRTWIPPWSVFSVTAEALRLTPLTPPEEALADDIDRGKAREVILRELSDGEPRATGPLFKAVAQLSGREDRIVSCDPVYQVLFDLQREGLVSQQTARMPGAREGLTAPQFRFSLADHGD